MKPNEIPVQEVRNRYGQTTRYKAELRHEGLNEYKLISDKDEGVLRKKIANQFARWEEKWQKVTRRDSDDKSKEEAKSRTEECQSAMQAIENLLIEAIQTEHRLDWDKLKARNKPAKPDPLEKMDKRLKAIRKPEPPNKKQYPDQPREIDFKPKLSIFDKLTGRQARKVEESRLRLAAALEKWELHKARIDSRNREVDATYDKQLSHWEEKIAKTKDAVAKEHREWEQELEKRLKWIDTLREDYVKKNAEAVKKYCRLVLEGSRYPEGFPKEFEVDYMRETGILIVEYLLPPIEAFPTVTEVRYMPSEREFRQVKLSSAQLAKMFDSAMYKIALRSLYELFNADVVDALRAITLNGWIKAVNRATGKQETTCILSIQVQKAAFMDVDLTNVDPKSCFKNFKGVGSAKLSGISPIQPIMLIDRHDKRFVSSREVARSIDDSTNLAAMAWEDFEHLVRELFEKEFSSNGGEVKVTQASRDGGVDAIAFDPDPIRGGKIAIQAKRYTNTVGVSAVRDLYGTVLNEGATKGILVTTTDYGPDAYEFAKGKPLTLLSGSNLLHLLEKHGHKARIDLKEAKRLLAGQDDGS